MKYTNEYFIALLIYVDDIILIGTSVDVITDIKCALHSEFTIKVLGFLKYILGLEVARSSTATMLSQIKFISYILKDASTMGCKPTSFPLPKALYLSPESRDLLPEILAYRRLIGRLLYVNLTRPYIYYIVQHLIQFMNIPRKPYWEASLYVLKYLKGTLY